MTLSKPSGEVALFSKLPAGPVLPDKMVLFKVTCLDRLFISAEIPPPPTAALLLTTVDWVSVALPKRTYSPPPSAELPAVELPETVDWVSVALPTKTYSPPPPAELPVVELPETVDWVSVALPKRTEKI